MPNKIYFVVGAVESNTIMIVDDLVNSYRSNNQTASVRVIGRPEMIENSGLKLAGGTLERISSALYDNSDQEAVVFVGWRVVDHLEQIYNGYKDSATFIFIDDSDYGRDVPENIEKIISRHKENVARFLRENSITLNYQTVAQPIFDKDRNLNLSNNGIKIAILGSM